MTETPTITPEPTAIWATPLPREFTGSEILPEINLPIPEVFIGSLAEEAVLTYHVANTNGYIDGLFWVAILLAVLFGMRKIIKEIRTT